VATGFWWNLIKPFDRKPGGLALRGQNGDGFFLIRRHFAFLKTAGQEKGENFCLSKGKENNFKKFFF